ncbi:MAG: hypothetical protein K2P70_18230 [Hyphomonadaceae bacterium]|nr:hypothetical protein [Hyphomonadaceae bacterium]
MTFFKSSVVALLFSTAFVTVAAAQPEPLQLATMSDGHTYFNRPGADIDFHDAELTACLTEAARVVSVDEAINGNSGIVGGLMVSALSHGVRPAAIENCMVVRGWRVVRVPEAEGEALSGLAPAEIQARLAEWIGLETPHGEIVRVWTNAAADSATDRFQMRPRARGRLSLSVASLGEREIVRSVTEQPRIRDARRLRQNRLTAPGPDQALIVVMTGRLSFRDGIGMSFLRIDPEAGLLASAESRDDANHINARVGLIAAREEGNWLAFLVPAGTWRLHNMGILDAITFCLGAPAFEARGGEVIFAGAFDLGGILGPDLQLEPARQWLSESPELAQAVQAAQYTNGWTSECGGSAIYALEVENAPFRDGYQWGSRAPASVAAPVPDAAASEAEPVETPEVATEQGAQP